MDAVKILIVEDEWIIAHSLQDALQNDGYQVVGTVDSADLAMALIPETNPDIILMDIWLKDAIDGITLSQNIQKHWNIPIVYLTAYDNRELIQRAKITHPYGYILKPYQFSQLKIALEMALNHHRYEQEKQNYFQEEIAKAKKVKQEFLINIKHEIRTPMNVIQGFSQLLQSELEDRRLHSYLNSIIESGDLLMKMLEDIIELAQFESGDVSLSFNSFDLRILTWEIDKVFQNKAGAKNLNIVQEIDEKLPKLILLDERYLKKILINLIDNSIKFTDKGTITIRVNTRKINQSDKIELKIAIQDTGVGIPCQYLSSIFDLFCQADSSLTRNHGGMGLGLTLAKKMTEYLGGRIEVESQENQGSIFTLIFPEVEVSRADEWPDFVNYHRLHKSPTSPNFRADNPSFLPELLTRLQLEKQKNWPKVKTKLIFSELNNFALEIYQLGQTYPYQPLQIYAEKLLQQISVFDSNISSTLEEFSILIEDLEKLIKA